MLEYCVPFTNWLQFSSFHLFHTPMCVKTASKSLLKLKKKILIVLKCGKHCVIMLLKLTSFKIKM